MPSNTTKEQQLHFLPQEASFIDTTPLSSTFTETFIFEPAAHEQNLGNLYIVGQIYSSKKRKENAELLSSLVDIIKNEYYRNPKMRALSAFKMALKRTNIFLEHNQNLFFESALKINMSVVTLAGTGIYATRLYDGILFVIRDKEINSISSPRHYTAKSDKYVFKDVHEGNISDGDTIVLATPQIYKLGKSKFEKFFLSSNLDLGQNEDNLKNIGLITISVRGRSPSPTPQLASLSTPPEPPLKLTKETLGSYRSGKGPAGPSAQSRNPDIKESVSRSKRRGKPRIFLFLTLIILLVSIITISAITLQRVNNQKKNEGEIIIAKIESLKERTKTLLELENYSEAEVVVLEWQEKLAELKSLGTQKNEVLVLKEEILNEYTFKARRYEEITGVQGIVNLDNNAVGFRPDGFIKNKNNLILFSQDTLYQFNLNTKSGSFNILPARDAQGKEISNVVRDIYLDPANQSVSVLADELFLLTKNAILSHKNDRLEVIIEDKRLEEVIRINIFNDVIYLLTPQNIWQLNFKERHLETWLSPNLSLANASDFTIDGFIYVLNEKGISKFLSGRKNNEISVDEGTTSIATNANIKNLYLLNSEEGILTISDKFGNVLRRLINEKLIGAKSIVLDEDEKTLYFLKGERVFSFGL